MRRLIITADDFGLSVEVNEAVETAFREGVLTSASLMPAEPAAMDAVARAHRLKGLRVGLHLTLTDGAPVLPPGQIPHLVGANGRFRQNMAAAGAEMFFRPAVRRELAAEIDAQFRAFAATGLHLDHVDGHKHFHVHPTIAGLTLAIGARYGLSAMRVPYEPEIPASGGEVGGGLAAPWAKLLRRRARRHGLTVADAVFGLSWSGAMTTDRLVMAIEAAPPGLTEIYLHPATADRFGGSAPGYQYRQELAALISPSARKAIARACIALGGYSDFRADAAGSGL